MNGGHLWTRQELYITKLSLAFKKKDFWHKTVGQMNPLAFMEDKGAITFKIFGLNQPCFNRQKVLPGPTDTK